MALEREVFLELTVERALGKLRKHWSKTWIDLFHSGFRIPVAVALSPTIIPRLSVKQQELQVSAVPLAP